MKIFLGADHNGENYKKRSAEFLKKAGHEVIDNAGANNPEDDFPTFAGKVCHSILSDKDVNARGILICGSGQGMAMAANRFKGIRASLCWSLDEARASRNDDDANVLCLPSRYLDWRTTEAVVNAWLATPYAGAERFTRRIKQLDRLP